MSDIPGRPRRRSRWAPADPVGIPATIPSNLTREQERVHLLHIRIQDLNHRLGLSDFGIAPTQHDRSPSPLPEYDSHGKRTNTRPIRTRKKLEDERSSLVQEMMRLVPEYRLMSTTSSQQQQRLFNDRVDIPQDAYPHINFLGLIIGPRGNSLKSLERETGARVVIRGKGSSKSNVCGDDEPLHAFVSGASVDAVSSAVSKLTEVIRKGIEEPEALAERRRCQLKELALLNGTYRESTEDGLNRLKAIETTIICKKCNGAGHLEKDCITTTTTPTTTTALDLEYQALMNELNEQFTPNPHT